MTFFQIFFSDFFFAGRVIREVREEFSTDRHSAFPAPWPSALAWPRATATRTRGCGPVRGSARGVCSDEHLSQHLTCWTETLADEPLDLLQGLASGERAAASGERAAASGERAVEPAWSQAARSRAVLSRPRRT